MYDERRTHVRKRPNPFSIFIPDKVIASSKEELQPAQNYRAKDPFLDWDGGIRIMPHAKSIPQHDTNVNQCQRQAKVHFLKQLSR